MPTRPFGSAAAALVTACALALAGCGDSTSPGQPPNRDVIFASLQAGDWNIFVADVAGKEIRQLTTNPGIDLSPAYAPDRKRIAFASISGDTSGIYVMRIDGSERQLLQKFDSLEVDPRLKWSPDGARLAYHAFDPSRRTSAIYVLEIATSTTRVVRVTGYSPSWSSDGRRIVYNRTDRLGLFEMNADGSGERMLIPGSAFDGSYSPDGLHLLYSQRFGPDARIFVANADGSGSRPVTTVAGTYEERGVWSPDGQDIVFMRTASNDTNLWTMRRDGSEQQRITFGMNVGGGITW